MSDRRSPLVSDPGPTSGTPQADHPVIDPDAEDATDQNHEEPAASSTHAATSSTQSVQRPDRPARRVIARRPQRVAPALRGVCLASSVSRQAPLPAPAAALACSHLSRARSAGARSARPYQRRAAVARAAATVARPASPIRLASPTSKAAAASIPRGTSCNDGSVRRAGATMAKLPLLSVSLGMVTGGAYRGFSDASARASPAKGDRAESARLTALLAPQPGRDAAAGLGRDDPPRTPRPSPDRQPTTRRSRAACVRTPLQPSPASPHSRPGRSPTALRRRTPTADDNVRRHDRVGGLIHEYQHVA